MKAVVAVLLPLLLVIVNFAPAAARPTDISFYKWENLDPAIQPGTLLRYKPMPLPMFYRAKAWRILYMTRDYAGKPIVSSGMVVLSGYANKNPRLRDTVAWAHPTTGIARKCAPSLRQSPTESIAGFNELIAAGYIVAATDYPGLGTRGPIGYLVGAGQGQAAIDSVRAARQVPEVLGSGRYALWGYSQGAHAALFGAKVAAIYAPELELVGVAATAPPTDLRSLLIADMNSVAGHILGSFTLQSWSVKYNADLSNLVDKQTAPIVAHVASNCVDHASGAINSLMAQKPLKSKFLTRDPGTIQPWADLLKSNSILQLPGGLAGFVAQGSADQIVLPAVTARFVRLSCSAGSRIKFVQLPGADHARSADASAPQAVAWIKGRFAGEIAPTSCR
jgi:Secretory lipase